jgi:RNA polymerase sigma-70 factor (ECF subfamily)
MDRSTHEVTHLLVASRNGDREALERLMELVYTELRQIAARFLHVERRNHTLQPTALIHEVYLRLLAKDAPEWENRAHFFGCAARVMRRVLVDYARAHRAEKRGGAADRVGLDGIGEQSARADLDLAALDDALSALEALNPQHARIVELKFFGGLTNEETAEALGLSIATVRRAWTAARLWLQYELMRKGTDDA